MRKRTSAVALLLSAWPTMAGSQVRRGGEFQVNTYTTGNQGAPAIASDASGNFLVAWIDYALDGSGAGVFARRYDAAGNPLSGSQFQVNTYTTGDQRNLGVAADPSGNMIVVWQSPQDSMNVYARRYDASGTPIGSSEFRVNASTAGYQGSPKVAMAGDGSFVVTWTDQDGSAGGISARRYDASGIPGPDFRVNSFTTGYQYLSSAAADAAGNFVIVWVGKNQDGDSYGVFGQRYDSAATRVGSEFQVNSYTTSGQTRASVAMAPDGRFMVAWDSYGQDGSLDAIAARRFDSAGVPQGGDVVVNTYTFGQQALPSVAADARGNFVVTWQSPGADGDGSGVFGRRYDAAGSPDPPFQINTYVFSNQSKPVVGAASNGDFVVAWQSYRQEGGYDTGVYAQRFSPDLIFRDGFESGTLTAWSASLTDGGNLAPSAFGALNLSSIGLQGLVNDTNSLYVEDDLPHDENRYRARFYFDTNGFNPGEAQSHFRTRIFLALEEAPTRRLAAVVLKRQGGAYSIEGRCRLDDNTQADTGFFPISNAPHVVEIDWRRSTGPSANDGRFELFVDGVSVAVLSNLDNSVSAVDFVRLGALSVKPGATGTLYWDEFESRRGSYIGP
jgi:hypothetical protein